MHVVPVCVSADRNGMSFPFLRYVYGNGGAKFRKKFAFCGKVEGNWVALRRGERSASWSPRRTTACWGKQPLLGVGVWEVWVLELKGTCKWVLVKDFIVQRDAVAAEMASRSVRSCTGLRRKADAPPSRARSRAFGKS